jgi:hypothetical protein
MHMHTTQFWHRFYLSSHKIVFVVLMLCSSVLAKAQDQGYNMLEDDSRPYHFGITAGFNNSQYRIFHNKTFLESDSLYSITPEWSVGFQVGIAGNLRLTNHLSTRFTPQFVLTQKNVLYDFKYNRDTTIVIESIMMHLPLCLKLSSDRIGNFRFYTIAGGKLDYDFNSNTRSRRNDEVLKVRPWDYGYELGVGFDFYNTNFIFSPEIKISNGFGNIQKKDLAIPTSRALDVINTRMIFLGFTIGG